MTYTVGPNLERVLRLLVGMLGGYGFTAGYIALIGSLLSWLGMHRAEAVTLAFVSGLIVYVFVVIWAAATTALLRTGLIIIAASGLMIVVAPIIAKGITP